MQRLSAIKVELELNWNIYKKANNNLNTNNVAFYKKNIDINNVQM